MDPAATKGTIDQLLFVFSSKHIIYTLSARSMLCHAQDHWLAFLIVKLYATQRALQNFMLAFHLSILFFNTFYSIQIIK